MEDVSPGIEMSAQHADRISVQLQNPGFCRESKKSQVQENAREREKKESASGRYFPAATCDSFRSGTIEANASLVMFSCASFR